MTKEYLKLNAIDVAWGADFDTKPFWAWLDEQDKAGTLVGVVWDDLKEYLKPYGYVHKETFLNPADLQCLKYTYQHWWWLKLKDFGVSYK